MSTNLINSLWIFAQNLCLLPYNNSQRFQDHSDPQTEPKQLISSDIELAEERKK